MFYFPPAMRAEPGGPTLPPQAEIAGSEAWDDDQAPSSPVFFLRRETVLACFRLVNDALGDPTRTLPFRVRVLTAIVAEVLLPETFT